MPVQQHLSTCFFASLQNSFPFFCGSQQHVFTSLPVSVHFMVIGVAADTSVPIVNAVSSGSHFPITFINSPPSICFTSSRYTLEPTPRSNNCFKSLPSFEQLCDHDHQQNDQKDVTN
jgi:hypothetical protein